MKPQNKSLNTIKNRFTDALIEGNSKDAYACVSYILAEGWGEKLLYKKIFIESLREIGELWHDGKISISHENRATGITLDIMSRLRQNFKSTENSPLIIVTSPKTDLHVTGARMFADFLMMDGWKVDFITNQVPLFDLKKFIEQRSPDLVAISVTMDSSITECDEITSSIQNMNNPVKVIWGGPGINKCVEDSKTDYDKDENQDLLKFKIKSKYYTLKSNPDFVCCTFEYFESEKCKGFLSKFTQGSFPINLDKTLDAIGSKIRSIRISKGLSQAELAKSSSIDRAFLSSVENGKRNLSISALHKISKSLDVSLNEIMN